MLLYIAALLSAIVVIVSVIRHFSTHHSHIKFGISALLFRIWVLCYRISIFFGFSKPSSNKISLHLQLLNEWCRDNVRNTFSNHNIDSALDLLLETRRIRASFIDYSMAPTKEKITSSNVCGMECVWVSKENLKNGVIVSFHGGAYISGCARSCLPYLAPLVSMTKFAGLSVEYSLCPETLLPKQIEEGLSIYKYLTQKLKINPKSIVFVGDSAGASLLILLIQKIIKMGLKPVACAICMSSWDIPNDGDSYIKNDDKDTFFDKSTGIIWSDLCVGNIDIDIEQMKCKYIENKYSLSDPRWSYLHSDASFNGFPPLFLSASEYEIVLDDTLRVVERCKQCGVKDVICEITPNNGIHVLEDWIGYAVPESMELIQKEAQFIMDHTQHS